MAALNAPNPDEFREKQFDELLDFSHYNCVNEMRVTEASDEQAALVQEELFDIAHFMLREAAWTPYKESLLAMTLMEKSGSEAAGMWGTLLRPLERAYEATSGQGFLNRFGHPFFRPPPGSAAAGGSAGAAAALSEGATAVASTRAYAEAILRTMASLAKEAGFKVLSSGQERAAGIETPKDRAVREAQARRGAAGGGATAKDPTSEAALEAAAGKATAKDEKRREVEERVAAALRARAEEEAAMAAAEGS